MQVKINFILILKSCLITAITLILFEVVIRLYTPADTYRTKRISSIHFELLPNWSGEFFGIKATTDSNGFRKNPLPIKSNKNIIFIGDSMIFGVGVAENETIPVYFERELNKGDKKYRLINAAVSSYSTVNYLYRFRDIVKQNQDISLITVGFFAGNDYM